MKMVSVKWFGKSSASVIHNKRGSKKGFTLNHKFFHFFCHIWLIRRAYYIRCIRFPAEFWSILFCGIFHISNFITRLNWILNQFYDVVKQNEKKNTHTYKMTSKTSWNIYLDIYRHFSIIYGKIKISTTWCMQPNVFFFFFAF